MRGPRKFSDRHTHDLWIAGQCIPPGEKHFVSLPLAKLPTQACMELPVVAVNGVRPGPRLWLSAAVHGDELNGVEIVRRVHQDLDPQLLHGAVLAVPIVNVFGFLYRTRFLPDGRDLNRSFPGSRSGSLAKRLAHVFMTEIVNQCEYGIDMHTAAEGRINLPQIRANLDSAETLRCAKAFGAPVVLDAKTRDGSLRQAASNLGINTLLLEAGEAHRFNRDAIAVGVRGVFNVLAALAMYPQPPATAHRTSSRVFHRSKWVRATGSGILRLKRKLGQAVDTGELVGVIDDPFGQRTCEITSPVTGIIIGAALDPLVSEGDAVLNLAYD